MRKNSHKYSYSQALLNDYLESKKLPNIDRSLNKRLRICFSLITCVAILFSLFYGCVKCVNAYIRIGISLRDLGISVLFYLSLFVPFFQVTPTVNELPTLEYISFLPKDFETFAEMMSDFGKTFFSYENFILYLKCVVEILNEVYPIIVLLLPFLILFKVIPDWINEHYNVNWGEKTKPLSFFEKAKNKVFYPVKRFVVNYVKWNKGHHYKSFLIFIWVCNLNGITVIIGFISWYFYFAKSFDFVSIYYQIVKLTIDLLIFIDCSFAPLTVLIVIVGFNKLRKYIAGNILKNKEAHNSAFVESLPVCTLVVGKMGAGKTQLLVDMGLTKSLQLRNEALKRMYKYELYFPNFPWTRFEKRLQLKMKRGIVFNLASVKSTYAQEREEFERCPDSLSLYGYDIKNLPVSIDIGNKILSVWDAIEAYAQLYFVYILQNSLIISNFSVREDYMVKNCGNFILYENDFFSHKITDKSNHFSHILDYDILRMGRTMVENTKVKNCFEFGVVLITEIGKERGNGLENIRVKKNDSTVNVKNDLFVSKLKMIRHAATIDNYCFCAIISDEQRPMSLDADMRQVCDQIIIKERSSMKLAYPFFFVESLIYDLLKSTHMPFHYGYKFSHGNCGLFAKMLFYCVSAVVRFCDSIYDRFGFSVLTIYRIEGNGTDDTEEKELYRYYLSYGKIYNNRYATDTHAEYCLACSLESGWSFDLSNQYKSLYASKNELLSQHSFFVNEMIELGETDKCSDVKRE